MAGWLFGLGVEIVGWFFGLMVVGRGLEFFLWTVWVLFIWIFSLLW